ncbi:MAG: right-handed parallel beta-helix repeat-containing protein [Proteobacteria bacterium]|nr:right-handed parallel beta-helix repeat-containing protein [Pseudomonadota bacterium]
MHRIIVISVMSLVLSLSAACGDSSDPCDGITGTCIELEPGPDIQTRAQTALIEAKTGDGIVFLAGTHQFDRDLSLDVDGVTVRGEGMDETILSFADQTEGAQAFLVTADDFTIEDIAIEDPAGDGIKTEGTTGVFIRRVRVEWSGPPSKDNGAYGLYPVQSRNVLVEDSVVRGASDAGIYVGQSNTIIVRRNRAELNVAGIEIEASYNADVYENIATDNTGGLLVANVPGLPMPNGSRTRVFNNEIYGNNTDNFAPSGVVAQLPRGTGLLLLSAHEVEVFDNQMRDNKTSNMSIVSYLATGFDYDDPSFDPYTDTIYVHDNTFGPGGDDYDKTRVLGSAVVEALRTILPEPVEVPSIVFFGMVNPDKADSSDPRRFQAAYNLCVRNNGSASFANLDFANNHAMVSTDLSPHDCEHPSLPAVTIPGIP